MPSVTQKRVETAGIKVEALLQELMKETGVPGAAMAIVHRDDVVYSKGFGVRRVGSPDLVDENTVFQLASLSKPLSSTIVAALVGDGRLSWDDPVIKYKPDFALGDPWVTEHVTLADLFSHRSGLPDHAGDLLEDVGYSREQILRKLRLLPLAAFRDSYAYTNFGLTAAAEAAANTTGSSWEDMAEKRLFKPMRMTSTSYRFQDFEESPNRAWGHVETQSGWEPKFVRRPDAQSPAGGASSNVVDMAQWLRLQLADGKYDGRVIVDSNALAQTHTPHSMMRPPSGFYGLGWNVSFEPSGLTQLSHSGAFALGASTSVVVLPEEEVAIIVLTNALPTGVPETVTRSFADLVLFEEIQADWYTLYSQVMRDVLSHTPSVDTKNPPANPEAEPEGIAGVYSNSYFGSLTVERLPDGHLRLQIGPANLQIPLEHWSGPIYTFQSPGENSTDLSTAIFASDASSVTLEWLEESGFASFHKTQGK